MCGRSTQISKETVDTYVASTHNAEASNGPATPYPSSARADAISLTGAAASYPTQDNVAEAQAFQPKSEGGVIYCSWCGKERAVNAQAIHHCGSKERPAVYCMNCGTSFEEGATSCTSCGTPVTAVSR
jgi:hypothetical protein